MSEYESKAMEERKLLSGSGILIVNVVVDSSQNLLLCGPDVVTRGFVYIRESSELLHRAKLLLRRTMYVLLSKNHLDVREWEQQIVHSLSKFVDSGIGRPL